MSNTITQTQEKRLVAATLKEQVMQLLQWDDMAYALFQYESGIAYLGYYIPKDVYGQEMLTYSRIFWNWWKQNWISRDRQFCMNNIDKISLEARREIYTGLHDARTLAAEIYPNGVVLGESYKAMIGQVFDKEMKEGVV